MRNQKILVVGAGLSGSVVANELAHHNWQVDVIDIRSHLGGTCYTKRDDRTGIMLHMYGPHIIHTNSQFVWEYLGSLAPIQPYINRVKAIAQGKRYSLPINLQTINAFFNRDFTESEAKQFIHSIRKNILHPQNFEEQALSTIGKELYQAFFYGYSKKQWGTDPTNLSASVFKKLPVRFTNNDNYYDVKYQGIPEQGYSVIIETLLRHPAITVHLNTP